ncbi:MAG TPA: DinB family protein, partial [Candidatus Acidoferrum sp.]|nr:DinB family protein [Candidatus Acidoferrum sp.]
MKLAQVFSNYFTVRAELIGSVAHLTQAEIDWVPPNHSATIGALLAHIAGSESWWLHGVALNDGLHTQWATFRSAKTLPEILAVLDQMHRDWTAWMESQDVEDWDDVFYTIEKRGEKVSKRWLVWHVVEHQSRHRGQIFMLMR